MNRISGQIIDVLNERIFPGNVFISNGRISKIEEIDQAENKFIMPGFIDAHVHVESSMLTPGEFGRMALPHGTVATVSDPHEIANVLGIEGVRYMIEDARKTALKIYFGAPSCVPATVFETAGAEVTLEDIESLFTNEGLVYLSEMMNFPGVIFNDPVVMDKIALAKRLGKTIDGHAPGLRGEDLDKYIAAGIYTDHECFTYEEALEKLQKGIKVIIREGSAAKNFEALIPLAHDHWENMMLCSDDKHPNDLAVGHINEAVARAVAKGIPLMKILRMTCINPIRHYGLEVGALQVGDKADFIIVNDLKDFIPTHTYINGELVAENGKSSAQYQAAPILNNFNTSIKKEHDFEIQAQPGNIRVIEALDGQLVTNELHLSPKEKNGKWVSDIEKDILKITVVNRYSDQPPAVAFIRNFGLESGAIASSVAHDSHNIVAVGTNDQDLTRAVNAIIEAKGGLSLANGREVEVLPLPVAGIMTNKNGYEVADQYTLLDKKAKELGAKLGSPYMTLSFMALLVIPQLKLSDKGLFDGKDFKFVDLNL